MKKILLSACILFAANTCFASSDQKTEDYSVCTVFYPTQKTTCPDGTEMITGYYGWIHVNCETSTIINSAMSTFISWEESCAGHHGNFMLTI